jgi:hypothetical protein
VTPESETARQEMHLGTRAKVAVTTEVSRIPETLATEVSRIPETRATEVSRIPEILATAGSAGMQEHPRMVARQSGRSVVRVPVAARETRFAWEPATVRTHVAGPTEAG